MKVPKWLRHLFNVYTDSEQRDRGAKAFDETMKDQDILFRGRGIKRLILISNAVDFHKEHDRRFKTNPPYREGFLRQAQELAAKEGTRP